MEPIYLGDIVHSIASSKKIIGKIRRIVKMLVDKAKHHFQPDNGFQDFFDLGDNLSIAIQKQFGYRQ